MSYPLATSSPLPYVGIGKQSSKGTGVAPTRFFPYRSPVSLDHGMGGESVYEAGTGPYVTREMKTMHAPSGQFGGGARPATTTELLAWFLGDDTVTGAGPYTHTLIPDPAVYTWLSIEQAAGDDGDILERFVDAQLLTATLTAELGKDLIIAYGWGALSTAWQSTAATSSYESGVNGSTPGANFRHSDASYTVDGSSATNVQTCEIGLEWRVDDVQLNAITRAHMIKLELSATVKVKQLLDGTAAQNAYRAANYGSSSGTAAAAEFAESGALAVVYNNGLTSTNERELSVTLPKIAWKPAKYTDLDPAGATMYVEREGKVTKASGSELITVVGLTGDNSAYV